jgi:two-component system, NtrC family, response regulator HydG
MTPVHVFHKPLKTGRRVLMARPGKGKTRGKSMSAQNGPNGPGTEETLKKLSYDLRERVKELNCLYAISELFEKAQMSFDEILQGTIDIIPSASQYPEITCARITFGGRRYETQGFTDSDWNLSVEFVVSSEETGLLEVCYREPRPPCDEGPFLKEEVKLYKVIADKLAKILWIKLAENSLRESEERYRTLAEHVTEGVTLQQEGKLLFMNAAFAQLFGLKIGTRALEGSVTDLISKGLIQCTGNVLKCDEKAPDREAHFRTRCTTPGGKEFYVEGDRIIIQLKGKPAVLSTFRDCTQTVRHEMAMKEEAELLRLENIHLRSSLKERFRFRNILGKSMAMQEVYELILKAAHSDASAAVFGESGTGKELVARAIHELSGRNDKEFVTVNCGAIPENLLESEFFGHKKGAFTGAYADKAGYLDIADGGTLFLDEVGELTLNMQVKLLRAIDGGDYTPVGSSKLKRSNFRVIAATNRSLIDLVKEGGMREDFYYRIHVIPINLPPLRERKEDIPLLIDHFLGLYRAADHQEARIPAKMLDVMFSYPWPGNVRELQNVIRRYLSVGNWDFLNQRQGAQKGSETESYSLKGAVEDLEKAAVKKALEQARWNRTKAAQMLGISRRALFRKMKRLELS